MLGQVLVEEENPQRGHQQDAPRAIQNARGPAAEIDCERLCAWIMTNEDDPRLFGSNRYARKWPAWGLAILCLLAASTCSSQQIARVIPFRFVP